MGEALRQFKSEIFQALANPTRIAIVEALREGEMSAGKLIEKLGIEQANASQHLSILRARQIVVNRKVGNQVFYSIRDPALIEVLDILRRYFYSQLSQHRDHARRSGSGRRQMNSLMPRIPWQRWKPRLLECLPGYSRKDFLADIVAGLTVGLVALPLAMAFGIASGVTPQAGIYTAVVGGFIVSALGGSRIQIGGPTGAFVVIVAGIIARHGL